MSPAKLIQTTIHAPHLEAVAEVPAPAGEVKRARASILTKAQRLAQALWRWKKAGRPLTGRAELKARLGPAGCGGCGLYDPRGNFGFGECAAPGCGCTKFKAWLATETCPHPDGSRWVKPSA